MASKTNYVSNVLIVDADVLKNLAEVDVRMGWGTKTLDSLFQEASGLIDDGQAAQGFSTLGRSTGLRQLCCATDVRGLRRLEEIMNNHVHEKFFNELER